MTAVLGDRNDIVCSGIEEKHGIHASATCSMTLGSKGKCIGYLLGEERQGMKIMFNMINHARMSTGLQGMSYASAAYLLAVNYARERIQGRDLENFADHGAPSVAIIRHPDVRRNLLWMKSYVDGMRSFFYFMTRCGSQALITDSAEEQERFEDLFSMLTPIVKDYMAVKGHEVCVQAIQVFGGAGYTRDYLVEQYARDCKITSIYEGHQRNPGHGSAGAQNRYEKRPGFHEFPGGNSENSCPGQRIRELERSCRES